jgi:DNA-binding response OmpR family regulator
MAAKTILVVEDDPTMRQVLQQTLRSNGFDVALAVDALGAVTQARARKPELVLLDLGLPGGGGFTVMQRLRSIVQLSSIPILVVSGQDRTASEARALEAGATAYLQKPASPEQVLDAVRKIVGTP